MTLFEQVRVAAREVTGSARYIQLHIPSLENLAQELADVAGTLPESELGSDVVGGAAGAEGSPQGDAAESAVAFVITLDAVNFGSGWFPVLRKRSGRSGYFTIAESLRDYVAGEGALSAEQLAALTPDDCARIFGQVGPECHPEALELMALFAQSLNALGRLLTERYGGAFTGLVHAAQQRADRLVELLAEMPMYRDVAHCDGREVPFYKRAQITAMDLAMAFRGRGCGAFEDLDQLTMFADNLVPHVLRRRGVLRYDPRLAKRIDGQELLQPGSREEVEIRAAGVHAVERMVQCIREQGVSACASHLDHALWQMGQRADIKAHPRHRCRSCFY